MHRLGMASLLIAGAVALATPGRAEDMPVDLALVLAVDVSGSMDQDERRVERDGFIAAFRDREVIAAITGGDYGRIAVTYVEWAGPRAQQVIVPWRVIDGRAAAESMAAALAAAPSAFIHGTSISGALAFSSALFGGNGFAAQRQVIDVSGDGPNNMGPPVTAVRDAVVGRGIVINGLPLTLKDSGYGGVTGPMLDLYYEDCVIGGAGAFFVSVRAPADLADAVKRKLVLEIAGDTPGVVAADVLAPAPAPRIDCLIGEKTRPSWLDQMR